MLTVGAPAPDATFLDVEGNVVRLSDYWRARPTILLFLRHFG